VSSYHVFRARTRFLTVPRASCLVFMFCAPGLVFDGTEGIGSRFNFLRARTRFRLYRGRRAPFHVLRSRAHFWRYRGRRVPFSCFALLDSLSAVLWVSAPVFMFCSPGLIFGGTEGVGSCSCFAHLNSFSAVPTTLGPVFMFCVPRHVFGGVEGVGSRFHVLRP
jgi:hypothetical protein